MLASRKGLLAGPEDREAGLLIVRRRQDFDQTVKKTRDYLRKNHFRDVEIGEFSAVAEVSDSGFKQVLGAHGTATARIDGRKVEFIVFIVEDVVKNRGALILGTTKDERYRKPVKKALHSLRLKKQQ